MKTENSKQLCPTCKVGQDTYLLDNRNPFCPLYGLVQIPCIERNAVGAMRAIDAVSLARFLSDTRKISFDLVVRTMYETGKDISKLYRETGDGGLAKLYEV